MTEVKDEELQLKEDKQMYLLETKRLKTKTSELNEEVQELKQYKEVVDQLEAQGLPNPDDWNLAK